MRSGENCGRSGQNLCSNSSGMSAEVGSQYTTRSPSAGNWARTSGSTSNADSCCLRSDRGLSSEGVDAGSEGAKLALLTRDTRVLLDVAEAVHDNCIAVDDAPLALRY